jgi:hypothetical protein
MSDLKTWRQTLSLCWVFPVFIAWKLLLALVFVLPVPANDAYFFDGAAVNLLHGGSYANPTIARVFPICGTEFFSAYPPLYQAVLIPWMSLFGTSARTSLMLHAVLVSLFALLVLGLLRRLRVGAGAANLAGLLLFGLTFHDRPDSLAQVLGLLSLHALLRSSEAEDGARGRWLWLCSLEVALCLCTSLHIGAMYAAMAWAFVLLGLRRDGPRLPWPQLLSMALAPLAVAGLAVFLRPRLWDGFMENVVVTPSFTGYRLPDQEGILKVLRNAPTLFVAAFALLVPAVRRRLGVFLSGESTGGRLWLAIFLPALFAALASLFIVAPNYIHAAAYPQIPAAALLLVAVLGASDLLDRCCRWAVLGCAALLSLRALALSTWGLVCAADYNQGVAAARVRREVASLPENSEVLASSAYLYDLADLKGVRFYHADWIGSLGEGPAAFRPNCLVLSAYDYHRRYKQTLDKLSKKGLIETCQVESPGRVPVPDESPVFQRVVQHISWAPVIVRLRWVEKR